MKRHSHRQSRYEQNTQQSTPFMSPLCSSQFSSAEQAYTEFRPPHTVNTASYCHLLGAVSYYQRFHRITYFRHDGISCWWKFRPKGSTGAPNPSKQNSINNGTISRSKTRRQCDRNFDNCRQLQTMAALRFPRNVPSEYRNLDIALTVRHANNAGRTAGHAEHTHKSGTNHASRVP